MRLMLQDTRQASGSTVNEDDKDSVQSSSTRSTATKSNAKRDGEKLSSDTAMAAGDTRVFRDVWYRRFLKPFTSHAKDRPISLEQAFKLRVLRPVGIPVEQVAGFHEMFQPTHVHLSPLIGLIFTYNNFIDNLYRYGDPDEPAVVLIQSLFHALPGGEIQATHLGSSAGAHLSPDLIGKTLEELEKLRPALAGLGPDDGKVFLKDKFLELISSHAEYQASRDSLLIDVKHAEEQLEALNVRDAESKPIREKIKELEGVVVKRGKHKLRRLETELQKTVEDAAREKIQTETALLQATMEEASKEVESLRSRIVTSLDFKTARKALRRAQEMIELEEDGRVKLVEALVNSFYAYDLDLSSATMALPLFTTSTILLAFMWRKYDSFHYLKGYMESMERMGALRRMMWSMDDEFEAKANTPHLATAMEASKNLRHRHHKDLSPEEKAAATIVSISKPGVARRPPVVQFSYVRWADYSEFPDCGETALRNLFNQMLYNPETGIFDHELLIDLRKQFYPFLHQPLIDFYKRYPDPAEAADHAISKGWIDVVSGLNTASNKSRGVPTIRYRREQQQQNIASPLSNVLSVVTALFGVRPPDDVRLRDIVDQINTLRRGWDLQVDTSGIKSDGFGIVALTVGSNNVRYELQSYKPVHFGFVQAESLSSLDRRNHTKRNGNSNDGRYDYDVFRQLQQFSNHPSPTTKTDHDASSRHEKLALASMFVPYMFRGKKQQQRRRLLENNPSHYRLLFSDLYQSSQEEAVIHWAQSQHSGDAHLAGYVHRIRSYQEPTFLPQSASKEEQ